MINFFPRQDMIFLTLSLPRKLQTEVYVPRKTIYYFTNFLKIVYFWVCEHFVTGHLEIQYISDLSINIEVVSFNNWVVILNYIFSIEYSKAFRGADIVL